jgi:mannose-6-phosphate isomerase-like protein (cupin superfamily)
MRTQRWQLLVIVMLLAASPRVGLAQALKQATVISNEDVNAVLKRQADTHRGNPDNMMRVVDNGQYQVGVAIVHWGATGGGASATPSGNRGNGPTANSTETCGEQRPDATGPQGYLHDDTGETYVVISGSATLISGGTIVNGKRPGPTSEITTTLNGPSCLGTMVGFTSRVITEGDVVIIPEGVPHAFSAIPDHITYLSIRPDLKKVLPSGYVNPALKP